MDSAAALKWASTAFGDGRQDTYRTFHNYVSGEQPMQFATGRFESAFGKSFAKFAYNRTDSVVDAITDRMQVLGFGSAEEKDERTKAAAEIAQEIWDDNSMDAHEDDLEAEALTCGDSYAIVEMDPNDPDQIYIWPQQASRVRVRYSPSRPGRVEAAVRMWPEGGDDASAWRLNIYFPDRIEKYRATGIAGGVVSGAEWKPFQPDGDAFWPVKLPVDDTVPVFHFANNARLNGYGVSELASVIPIQDALNKSVMDLLVGQEFTAFRQRVLINVDLDDPKAREKVEQLEVGINRLISLVGSDDGLQPGIAEFSASDVRQYIGPIDLFDTMISRASKVPVHYLQMTGNFPSGEALRTAEAPFVAKVTRLQRRFGDTISRMMSYAVRLRGVQVAPGAIRVNWTSPMPLSQREQYEMGLMRQSLGYALKSNLREMGYEPSQIEQLLEEAREEREERIRAFNAGDIEARTPRLTLGSDLPS